MSSIIAISTELLNFKTIRNTIDAYEKKRKKLKKTQIVHINLLLKKEFRLNQNE